MEMNDDFAYFLGVMCGDGYISEKGLIDIKGESQEYFRLVYCPLINRLFGLEANMKYGKNVSKTGGVYYRSHFCSKPVSNLLNTYGIMSPKTFSVTVPKIIINSTYNIKSSFVRGVFDTDGSISTKIKKNIVNYPTLALSSRSKDFVCKVYEILLSLGLNARADACNDRGKPRYQVRLYGFKELQKYMVKIGFSHPTKHSKANKILNDGIARRAGRSTGRCEATII